MWTGKDTVYLTIHLFYICKYPFKDQKVLFRFICYLHLVSEYYPCEDKMLIAVKQKHVFL